jgi:Ca-activated chloride channel family protein
VRFREPDALLFLLLVPILVVGYLGIVRHRVADERELGTMAATTTKAGRPLGWRRHVVPAIFLLGVVVLLVGLARPQANIDLPHREGTVILAFDVSSSMKAKDLAPTRMVAAKRAARTFVADQPSSFRIGVVAFSDAGYVVQPPTRSRRDVLDAIGRLSPRGGTALGRGIVTSLGAVAGRPLQIDQAALEEGAPQPGVRFLGSAAIILLSDGDNTAALDPRALAPVAAQAGVRIFPIGIGSPNGAVVDVDGYQVATALDADLLRAIARGSRGTYFAATDAHALQRVYDSIDLKLTLAGRDTEITAIFAGVGLVLFLVAAGFSMRWHGRVI